MSEDNVFKPPRNLEIGGYKYSYKDQLINDYYTYRCTHRNKCKIVIKISKTELKEYNNNVQEEIKFEITSKEKIHTCSEKIIKVEKSKEVIDKKKALASALIMASINKSLSFHISNLKNNNIYLSKNQTKRLLQKIRENRYPPDDIFLKDISNIKITLDNESELKDINMCYKYAKLINPRKNNSLEKYIIFSSKFQMNLLKKSKQIHIDGTFKSCPKTFYQILNITAFCEDINGNIPIFMIPMSGKNEFIYNKVLSDVKEILSENNISLNEIPKNIMCDFEASLIKSVKNNFPNSKIDGCYFHFVKLLWSKAKSYHLCNKKNMKMTKILIFILKIIPFLNYDDRKNLFEKTKE